MLGDPEEKAGRRAAGDIEGAGGEAVFVRTDVTSGVDVRRLIDEAVDRCGRLDVIFNRRGPNAMGPEHREGRGQQRTCVSRSSGRGWKD